MVGRSPPSVSASSPAPGQWAFDTGVGAGGWVPAQGGRSPTACQHPFTCAGVVVDFISGGTHVADLPLAFDDAQLLLGGSRARHPHSWARL